MTATLDMTVRDIVANDYRAAEVFQRYGIDFCCGGDRRVADACRAKNVEPSTVLTELAALEQTPSAGTPRFNTWELPALSAYIVSNHHEYVRQAIPTVLGHTKKVAAVHGEHHPEMAEVASLFQGVADEMIAHMRKEEMMLFPFITALAEAAKAGRPAPRPPFGTVANPIRMMMMEHDSAGGAMARIKELTRGYEPPEDACTTFRVCLQELDAFERDLHAHVHLENNILFPKAMELETSA
jgi:regulator of cell morphogenesis and NO signaling